MAWKLGSRRLMIGTAALTLLAIPQAAVAREKTPPPALEAAIAASHEALRKILNGDPSGYAALFADREDITLGNPFGPFGKGREAVLERSADNLNRGIPVWREL
jgi:hypothetical protein